MALDGLDETHSNKSTELMSEAVPEQAKETPKSHLSVATELFSICLHISTAIQPLQQKWTPVQKARFAESHARLCLWRDNTLEGRLEQCLAHSTILHRSILDLLHDIGKAISRLLGASMVSISQQSGQELRIHQLSQKLNHVLESSSEALADLDEDDSTASSDSDECDSEIESDGPTNTDQIDDLLCSLQRRTRLLMDTCPALEQTFRHTSKPVKVARAKWPKAQIADTVKHPLPKAYNAISKENMEEAKWEEGDSLASQRELKQTFRQIYQEFKSEEDKLVDLKAWIQTGWQSDQLVKDEEDDHVSQKALQDVDWEDSKDVKGEVTKCENNSLANQEVREEDLETSISQPASNLDVSALNHPRDINNSHSMPFFVQTTSPVSSTIMDQPIEIVVGGSRRKRASKPKVKTGCINCKIRHIKCDEARPDCVRCTSTGRKCQGYNEPSPEASNSIVADPSLPLPPSSSTTKSVMTPHLAPVIFEGTAQERRSFHHFQVFTIPVLAGGSEYDLEFWQSTVLRASTQESVIHGAVLALAALHEDYHARGGRYDANLVHGSSDQLYIQSLHQLRGWIETTGKSVSLIIAKMLFTCIEILRRDDLTAILHHRAGWHALLHQMKIQQQNRSGSKLISYQDHPYEAPVGQKPLNELDTTLRVFARCNVQVCTFGGEEARVQPLAAEVPQSPPLPTALNVTEVRFQLENLVIAAHQLIYSGNNKYRYSHEADIPHDFRIHIQETLKIFEAWHIALEVFFNDARNRRNPGTVGHGRSLEGLRLQFKVAVITMETMINSGPETTFDRFRGEFEEIVSSVERLTQALALADAAPLGRESAPFTMELGIIHPLFFVASKCRESRLRRRAIAQLRKAGKEGMWEGPIMAVVAKRIMQVEERGLISGQVVPERNRIHKIHHTIDYDDRLVRIEATLAIDETWKDWETIREEIPF